MNPLLGFCAKSIDPPPKDALYPNEETCHIIRSSLSYVNEERRVYQLCLVLATGGHLIEFHLIESLDRNFSIKRLKIDQLIE